MTSNNISLSSRPRVKKPLLYVLLPFLEWLPELKDRQVLQADIVAVLTPKMRDWEWEWE